MKRHPFDLVSLIAGLAFGAIAILTLTGEQLIGSSWNGQWIGPVVLIAIGLIILLPKAKPKASINEPEVTTAHHAELPPEAEI